MLIVSSYVVLAGASSAIECTAKVIKRWTLNVVGGVICVTKKVLRRITGAL